MEEGGGREGGGPQETWRADPMSRDVRLVAVKKEEGLVPIFDKLSGNLQQKDTFMQYLTF